MVVLLRREGALCALQMALRPPCQNQTDTTARFGFPWVLKHRLLIVLRGVSLNFPPLPENTAHRSERRGLQSHLGKSPYLSEPPALALVQVL